MCIVSFCFVLVANKCNSTGKLLHSGQIDKMISSYIGGCVCDPPNAEYVLSLCIQK
jgi:acyl CoA:acetate/3-ketoacid CoA transferase alpha subunit